MRYTIYRDDVLVASSSIEKEDLHHVFDCLNSCNFKLNFEKCISAKVSLVFTGYKISSAGIRPDQERVAAIAQYPKPQTINQLKRYVGMTIFYHRYPSPDASIVISMYASGTVNQVVSQESNPLAFYLRKLTTMTVNYWPFKLSHRSIRTY